MSSISTPQSTQQQSSNIIIKYIGIVLNQHISMAISNLQFFWTYVLHQPWDKTQVPFRRFDVYLPFIPDRNLAQRFLELDDPKANIAVSILYSTGMRLDELCHQRCSDIYRDSGTIYIQRSKYHSDRYVSLTPSIKERIVSY